MAPGGHLMDAGKQDQKSDMIVFLGFFEGSMATNEVNSFVSFN